MNDIVGKTILHYKIIEKLGEGGMGEVFKAQDTNLDRFVALKFLPSQMTASEDDKARFIQEAKAASAMNHPNVCTIYSIEEYEKQLFIAMEYVDGKTLKDKKDSISEKQILEIGIQVAEGLAAAHEKGIVHRDIKPENIMVRKDGIVQIMDFGLAKLREDSGVSRLTKAGTTMGTLGYMSPEQVQGLDVDHRTDIFSLGVVIYELLAGESPFKGVHETAIMYEIVNVDPPPISTVKEGIEPELDVIILECLEKDKDERCQSAKELAKDLRKVKKSTGSRTSRIYRTQTITPAAENIKAKSGVFDVNFKKRIIKNKVPLAVITVLAVALLITIYFLIASSNNVAEKPAYVSIKINGGLALGAFSSFAISPDGSKIVYTVNQANARMLYIRDLNSYDSKPIPGTEGAVSPCFSPDGKWLAFLAENYIRKVLVSGGPVANITSANLGNNDAPMPYLYWGNDNQIYLTSYFTGTLYRIPAKGGKPEIIGKAKSHSNQVNFRWPVLLPDGKNLLITTESKNENKNMQIDVLNLQSGIQKSLIDQASYAQYMKPGYLLFVRHNKLFASKFDPGNNSLIDSPVPIIPDVATVSLTGMALFNVSDNGTLVYLPGSDLSENRNLMLVDRSGKILNRTDLHLPIEDFNISPDGKKVVMTVEGMIWSIYLYDIQRNAVTRLTQNNDDRDPVWTPDGKSIIYGSYRKGFYGLFIASLNNIEKERRLTKSKYFESSYSISPDGKYVAFNEEDSTGTIQHILVKDLNSSANPEFIANGTFSAWMPAFSPNGKFIAFEALKPDRNIYVVPFRRSGGRIQISTNGGTRPFWSNDGSKLYYFQKKTLMEVPVKYTPDFSAGIAHQVLTIDFGIGTIRYGQEIPGTNNFIMLAPEQSDKSSNSLHVILNWDQELKNQLVNAN